MIEFVGSKEILNFAKEEGFKTIRMTFEDNNPKRNREYFNVFEISEEEFSEMCNYEDGNSIHVVEEECPVWKDSWGWWRYSKGCNLENKEPTMIGKINNNVLTIWYNENKMHDDVECYYVGESDEVNEEYYDGWKLDHSEYLDLFNYCIEMWGCSTERNVTAIAIGLAKLNNMSLADLFKLSIEK